ncbi:MAG: carboxylesterase family protein [Myxococcota bacterium]
MATALACAPSEAPLPTADPQTERTLTSGRILGFRDAQGSHVWRGIPFAAPPTGKYRWRAPRSPRSWDTPREMLAFGARCPQYASPLDQVGEIGTVIGDEDCLTLNVFAPPFKPYEWPGRGRRLPVMVWFHGGGNVSGASDFYDGSVLARRHNVIVVTANYRLGPLGFFRHPALRDGATYEEESGNFATLDLIRALHWVQENAANFGGDPENVTIFGESAGARNVLMLLLAPGAQGLFHRAIVQSGGTRTSSLEDAEAAGERPTLGGAPGSQEVLLRLRMADGAPDRKAAARQLETLSEVEIATYLGEKTAAELLAAYGDYGESSGRTGLFRQPQNFRDGVVLPEALPIEALAAGAYAQVPIILGSNRDEQKLFLMANPEHVRWTFGVPSARDPERYELLSSLQSRFWKANGVDALASAMRSVQGDSVYAYRFDWDEEPRILWADLGQLVGAAHAIEIPFVFGHWNLGPQSHLLFDDDNAPGRVALSDAMLSYWAEFAWKGAPGRGRTRELPAWDAWDPSAPDAGKYLVLDTETGGGIRMEPAVVTNDALFVDLAQASLDEATRCKIYGDWVWGAPRVADRGAGLGCGSGRKPAAP